MYNDSERISANEINKYCFCPYQWYYERLYGQKYIRQKQKERIEALGIKNNTLNNFNKGLKFHNYYRLKRSLIFMLKLIILILLSVIIFIIFKLYFF